MVPETQRNQVDSENSGSSYKDDKSEAERDEYSSEASNDAVCVKHLMKVNAQSSPFPYVFYVHPIGQRAQGHSTQEKALSNLFFHYMQELQAVFHDSGLSVTNIVKDNSVSATKRTRGSSPTWQSFCVTNEEVVRKMGSPKAVFTTLFYIVSEEPRKLLGGLLLVGLSYKNKQNLYPSIGNAHLLSVHGDADSNQRTKM